MTKQKTVLFRADASDKLGSGDVMRGIYLAKYCKRYDIVIATLTPAPQVLKDSGVAYVELPNIFSESEQINDLIKSRNAVGFIYSGNYWSSADFAKLPKNIFRMYITNVCGSFLCPDANTVVNGQISVASRALREPNPNNIPPYTTYYYGPHYSFVRSNFNRKKEINKEVTEIVVSMGNSDPGKLTLKVMNVLTMPNIQKTIIIGRHFDADLKKNIRAKPGFTFIEGCDDLSEYFKRADIAILNCGVSLLEALATGISVIAIPQESYKRHQHKICTRYEDATVILQIPESQSDAKIMIRHLINNYKLRKTLFDRSKKFFDNKGISRIAQILHRGIDNGKA